jgi:hypothetical protein
MLGVSLFLGSFEKITKVTQCWGQFFHGKSCVLISTKSGLGYILGDLFTNASGQPAIIVTFG